LRAARLCLSILLCNPKELSISSPTRTLLLVEDEAIIAMGTKEALRAQGYEVLTALSGEDAIEAVRTARSVIDLVLMDIDLGSGMGGTEAAFGIQEIRDIPIIFLSSHTEAGIVARTESISSYGYVAKSSGSSVLGAAIRTAFRLREAAEAKEEESRHAREKELAERGVIEAAQTFLAQRGWARTGEDFFRSLARFLAETLSMDYVCIDCLEEGSLEARTVAVYYDSEFEDNVSYALRDTPCGEVVGKSVCCFPQGVRGLFPADVVLQEMEAEGYAGTTLTDSEGRLNGLIAVISRAPFGSPELVSKILQLVAGRAAGELERREAVESLKRSLAQTETLMRELQHRVKNNLYIISSLLSLEANGLPDGDSKKALLDAQSRVQSMAGIYERLYMSANLASVPMDQYFRDISSSILATYTADSSRIRLESSLQAVAMDTRRAVPLGLIMNELITNAIKHAFPAGSSGTISLSLESADGRVILAIGDDGAGFDQEAKPGARTGLGLTLVRSLARQIDARLDIQSAPGKGTRVSMEID
jgi:two-component sensor histidine kinase/DNA-binding NarL/FixJ family response regulator